MSESQETIAIVGMAGRFPGAKNVEELWRNLCGGVESISFFSDEDLRRSGVDPGLSEDPNYVRARGVLGDADLFPASFFGYSPRVAALMDPQHRLFIECAYEAAERAGYNFDVYPGRVGVFAGASMNTYFLTSVLNEVDLVVSVEGLQAAIGNDKDSLTTEVAYRLNLKGPAVTVQSSSSTSLVAIHFACQSLLSFECDMAISGGVSIHFPEAAGYLTHEGSPNSPSGHTRAFDHSAEGFVPGHGAGVVVLKRLADALEDGDPIHAVIRGSACNNDGALKVSYMAPSVEGQVEVVALAQAFAGVSPETIGYVECHGTGTAVGDPIEVAALREVFEADTEERHFCALGSIKTNIGHLDTAAGVSGLIKAALAVENGRIPPNLHFEKPNPQLRLEDGPFYVPTELVEWNVDGMPRRAAVTSLGMGGTNAHAVLEQPPEREPSGPSRPWQLLPLSARSETALAAMNERLAEHLEAHPELPLADVAFTLQIGRRPFEHRQVLIAEDRADAARVLREQDPERLLRAYQEAGTRPLVFLFPGHGGQYVGMGRELYEREPAFREVVDVCAEQAAGALGQDLRRVLYPEADEGELFDEPFLTQLVSLFVVEYGLARVWLEWGLEPDAMIGHSLGEYVAACLAGVFTLPEALRLVVARGRLMQKTAPGAMLALSLPEAEARDLLEGDTWLATLNAPQLSTVSGTPEAIAALQEKAEARGIECRRLYADHAYHSPMMEPALEEFLAEVRSIDLREPRVPYISNLTGTWIEPEAPTEVEYWGRHLCRTVRYAEGIDELLSDPDRLFLEVGPGRTLSELLRRHPQAARRVVVPSLGHPKDPETDTALLLGSLSRLWLAGAAVDWAGFTRHETRRRVLLPTYPFERQRYWIEPRRDSSGTVQLTATSRRRDDPATWFYTPLWRQTAPSSSLPEPAECLILGDPLGIGESLAESLQEAGHPVVRVVAGGQITQLDHGLFALDFERGEEYLSLFKTLIGLDRMPRRIVHLCSLFEPGSRSDEEGLERALRSGFESLTFLAQALGRLEDTPEIEITVVTSGLLTVTGSEREPCPEQATLLGPCRVMPQELSHVSCRAVDVETPRDEAEHARLVGRLAGEMAREPEKLTTVALRGSGRFVQAFEPMRLDKPEALPRRLREEGVYLVTGGLGGLGLEIAKALAGTARARLVLVGRSPFPEREAWSGWLEEQGDDDPVSRKILELRKIESAGGEVLVASADVTDAERMGEVVARGRERFGAIHGVVHAAGLPSSGTLQLKTREMARSVLAPKVEGTRVLDGLFADGELDFLVLFSSRTAFLGGFGQADYCGANAFLDAFAHLKNARSTTPVLSINWNAWREVGLRRQMMERLGLGERAAEGAPGAEGEDGWTYLPDSLDRLEPVGGVSPAEGVDLFLRLLDAPRVGQIAVSPEDLDTVIERARSLTLETLSADVGELPAAAEGTRPDLVTPYVAPRDDLERSIAASWQEILGVDRVGVNDNFFELGGNSLLGVKLCAGLGQELDTKFPMASLYENPTVSALAAMVRGDGESTVSQESLDRGARRRQKQRRRKKAATP